MSLVARLLLAAQCKMIWRRPKGWVIALSGLKTFGIIQDPFGEYTGLNKGMAVRFRGTHDRHLEGMGREN